MKAAVCFGPTVPDHADTVRKMAQAQCLSEFHDCKTFPLRSGAIGCVVTCDRFSSVPLLRHDPGGNLLMVTGVPIDIHGSLDARLQAVLASDFRNAAVSLTSLDGAFAALFWDARNHKLVIVTDCLGIQPLYVATRNRMFLLATELKAFPASGMIDVEMDPAAWGAFVSLGFGIADRTQLAGVRRVPPATTMVYDPSTASLDSKTYWSWPKPKPELKLEEVDTAEMLRITRREVECYTSHSAPGTILLSGGFDSRLILAILKRLDIDCRALILTHPESSADGELAARIAKRLNCRDVKRITPANGYYSSPSYLRYLVMNEVATQSMVLRMSPHVSEHIRPEMEAVWEGLGPGFAFAPSYPLSGGFATYLKDRCKDRDSPHWQAAFSVFSDSMGQAMYEAFRDLLRREMAKYTDDDFGTARFQMATQMRRFLALAPLAVYSNAVLPFTPCLSKDLWDLAAAIPLSVTSQKKLYIQLYKDHLPEAMAVPVCSGGKLVGPTGFAPALWARSRLKSLGGWSRYHWGRLPRLPIIGPAIDGMGLSRHGTKNRNVLFDAVVRHAHPDHPDLNPDRIRALQEESPPYSWPARLGRRMLFYWQTWRWILEGRLTTWNAETFMDQELAGEAWREGS